MPVYDRLHYNTFQFRECVEACNSRALNWKKIGVQIWRIQIMYIRFYIIFIIKRVRPRPAAMCSQPFIPSCHSFNHVGSARTHALPLYIRMKWRRRRCKRETTKFIYPNFTFFMPWWLDGPKVSLSSRWWKKRWELYVCYSHMIWCCVCKSE